MMKVNKNLREGVCFKEHINNFLRQLLQMRGLFFVVFLKKFSKWEINLSEWYWREGLADAGFTEEDIDNPSEELIDYILDELKYVDWDSLINDK